MLDAEPNRGVVVDSLGEHEPVDRDTIVRASAGGGALIGLAGERSAEVFAVLEIPTALVEVFGAGAVPLGRQCTVRVDAFGAFEKVRGVVAERRLHPRAADGVADTDELAVPVFVGEHPVLTRGRWSGMRARGEIAGA